MQIRFMLLLLWISISLFNANGEETVPKPSKLDPMDCYMDFPDQIGPDDHKKHKPNDCVLPCPVHANCKDGVAKCFPDHLYYMVNRNDEDGSKKRGARYCELTQLAKNALDHLEKGIIALTKRKVCGVHHNNPDMAMMKMQNQGKPSSESQECQNGEGTCPAMDLVYWFTIKDLMHYLLFSDSLDDFGEDVKEYQVTVIFLWVHWKRNYNIQIENRDQIDECILGGFEGYKCSSIKLGFTSDYVQENIVGYTGCLSVWAFSKALDLLTYFIKPNSL